VTDEHYARAALTYLAEPADTHLTALVRAHGPVGALEMIKAGHLPDAKTARRWRTQLRDLPGPADLARFAEAGIRLISPGDTGWPSQLADLGDDEPIALWLRGAADLVTCTQRSVSIVGSRAATAYGSYVAADVAATLAQDSWTIVSGGAYGILERRRDHHRSAGLRHRPPLPSRTRRPARRDRYQRRGGERVASGN
jgi:DNA processing protein